MNVVKIYNKNVQINKEESEKDIPNFDEYLLFFEKYYKKYLFFNESIDLFGSTNIEYTILNKKIVDERFFKVFLNNGDKINLNFNFTASKNKHSIIKIRLDILSSGNNDLNLSLFVSGNFSIDFYIFQKVNKGSKCNIKIDLISNKILNINIIYLYYLTRNTKINMKGNFKVQDKPNVHFCSNYYIASENNSVVNRILCLLNRGYGIFEYLNEGSVFDKSYFTSQVFYNYLKPSNIEFIYKTNIHSFCEKAKIKEILYKL